MGPELHEGLHAKIQEIWLDIQVIKVSVNKWTYSLCEELEMKIQGTQIDIQAAKMPTEVT
jgi:hypothetical protein